MRDLSELPPLTPDGPGKPGYDYLLSRGLSEKRLDDMVKLFHLRFEPDEERVAFPVREKGQDLGYTARAIHPFVRKRWRDHPIEGIHRERVYEPDRLEAGGDTLFIVEGPFDAVMVTAAMDKDNPSVATAFFGSLPSEKQLIYIDDAIKKYRAVYMAIDGNVAGRCQNLANLLKVSAIDIGLEFNDPAGMPFDELQLLVEYASKSTDTLITWMWDRQKTV